MNFQSFSLHRNTELSCKFLQIYAPSFEEWAFLISIHFKNVSTFRQKKLSFLFFKEIFYILSLEQNKQKNKEKKQFLRYWHVQIYMRIIMVDCNQFKYPFNNYFFKCTFYCLKKLIHNFSFSVISICVAKEAKECSYCCFFSQLLTMGICSNCCTKHIYSSWVTNICK